MTEVIWTSSITVLTAKKSWRECLTEPIIALVVARLFLKKRNKINNLSFICDKMPINTPIEVKIMDQKYCIRCMTLMVRKGPRKFVCPKCGEEEEFDYAEDGINY